jgi:hypothetical protein
LQGRRSIEPAAAVRPEEIAQAKIDRLEARAETTEVVPLSPAPLSILAGGRYPRAGLMPQAQKVRTSGVMPSQIDCPLPTDELPICGRVERARRAAGP